MSKTISCQRVKDHYYCIAKCSLFLYSYSPDTFNKAASNAGRQIPVHGVNVQTLTRTVRLDASLRRMPRIGWRQKVRFQNVLQKESNVENTTSRTLLGVRFVYLDNTWSIIKRRETDWATPAPNRARRVRQPGMRKNKEVRKKVIRLVSNNTSVWGPFAYTRSRAFSLSLSPKHGAAQNLPPGTSLLPDIRGSHVGTTFEHVHEPNKKKYLEYGRIPRGNEHLKDLKLCSPIEEPHAKGVHSPISQVHQSAPKNGLPRFCRLFRLVRRGL